MSEPDSPLAPRNGHTLAVGIVARISGCQNQKEASLEDQEDHARDVVDQVYPGPADRVDYRVIATKGKSERLDRPELAEIEALIRTRELDLLVIEDVGRLVRGAEAVRLIGIAVDHETRVIAPNDGIDTIDDTWEEQVLAACKEHVGHNAHTSRRLKQKLRNRFKKYGGAAARPIAGYTVPPGAKTYDDWRKDDDATAVYAEWFARFEDDPRAGPEVAAWLNEIRFPVGKYCKKKQWDEQMVRRVMKNTLLKGMPRRQVVVSYKHHEFGRRRTRKNRGKPVTWHAPHLAHLDPEYFDHVNGLVAAANKGLGRKPVDGRDPRAGFARTRTRFPAQHVGCWYCGGRCVWGGNGANDKMMCRGARNRTCWNSVAFDGVRLAEGAAAEVFTGLTELGGIDDQYRELVERACRTGGSDLDRRLADLERDTKLVAAQRANLLDTIAACGPIPMVREKLAEVAAAEKELARRLWELDRARGRPLILPASTAELWELLEAQFRDLAVNSPEFGNKLRLVTPSVHVYLVRLVDGGGLYPRARVTLDLSGSVSDAARVPGLSALLTREVTIDLFDAPQRERIRAEAARLAADGLEQRQIAAAIAEKPTQTAVGKALALDRLVRERGLASPYELVTDPPADCKKIRRYRHPRFRFTPLDGYDRPPI